MASFVDNEKAGGIKGLMTFAPAKDYSVLQGDANFHSASVFNKVRRQDFGGAKPIVWGDGATGIATVQHSGLTPRTGATIESTYPSGEAGHWELSNAIGVPSWRIAYNTGEALTAGTCRCQMSGYPTQAGSFGLDFEFQCGDGDNVWDLTTNGTSPALLWQLKPSTGQPVWSLNVDTDANDATKLQVYVSRKATAAGSVTRAATASGLERGTRISVRMEALLSYAANGWISWWVNGVNVYAVDGVATLQPDTSTYFQPIFGLYMFNDTNPATAPTRVLHLIRATHYSGFFQPTSTGVSLSNPRRLVNCLLG